MLEGIERQELERRHRSPTGAEGSADVPMPHRTALLVCRSQIAKVCEVVPPGLRVVVIGEEAFTERRVLHLAMWLEPDR